MYQNVSDYDLQKRIGYLSWSNGLQFFAMAFLSATVVQTIGFQFFFRRAPSTLVTIIVGLILLGDWLVNVYAFPAMALRIDKKLLGTVIPFLLFSFLGRFIMVFSLLIYDVKLPLAFTTLYWISPLGSLFFSVSLYLIALSPLAYSRGRRLRILAIADFIFSFVMFISGVVNYTIIPLDLQFWNILVFIYAYKVAIFALIFAFEYDSWSTEMKEVSKILAD